MIIRVPPHTQLIAKKPPPVCTWAVYTLYMADVQSVHSAMYSSRDSSFKTLHGRGSFGGSFCGIFADSHKKKSWIFLLYLPLIS